MAIDGEFVLDELPQLQIDNGVVLAGVGHALMSYFAAIDTILQHQVERAAGEPFAPASCPPAPSRRLLTMLRVSNSAASNETDPSST